MASLETMTYSSSNGIARITLDRPARGNGERDDPFGDAGLSTYKGWPR